jgi:hypothetical protein
MTGNVLGAAIDHRIGGGAMQTAAQWQWGEMTANRLVSLTSGKTAGCWQTGPPESIPSESLPLPPANDGR